MMFVRTTAGAACAVFWAVIGIAADPPGNGSSRPEADEFFESRIRPVLAENCFQCHGETKQKAGLRLDSRENLLKGSESGPVVVMGEPEKSPMVLAVRYSGDLKMPPKGKLSSEAIDSLSKWIQMGAPWPQHGDAQPRAISRPLPEEAHWAFQPIQDPPIPSVRDSSWANSPLDRFVLAKLQEKGLSPSPPADRRTLIRRLNIHLTGLPPTPEEVEAFDRDETPDALEKLVDRLLASPRHGERWGRHWLDIARYADTKGYVFEEERRYPYAYTYRDYVIRAFNEDLPYDRFLIEQIAADLLPLGEDKRPLAAMGFLTLGRRFLNNKPDIIDDRIDVVCRGIMALTVGCARCHDHKFDPIPTADYYSLYGVFASAEEAKDPPLIGMPEQSEAFTAFQKEVEAKEADVTKLIAEKHGEFLAEIRRRAGEYLLASAKPREERKRGDGEPKVSNLPAGELHPLVTARWRDFVAEKTKSHHAVLGVWSEFAKLKPEEFAAKAAEISATAAANADAARPINPLVAKSFAGEAPTSLEQVSTRYAALFAEAEKPADKREAALEEIRQILHAEGSPPNIPIGDIERFFDRAVKGKIRELRKKVDAFKASSPAAPPRAMSLAEQGKPHDPVVFLRGNASNPGKAVPRQFLGVLSKDRKPFQNGSGRLELAQAIASPGNPLTARVIVNRLWLHHFGAGLVRTPGDFGARSDPPAQAELLDYLASRLIEGGWSLKRLHRLILLSSTYQQVSDDAPEGRKLDPENRLLWRQNLRRHDFEAVRDSLLAVCGSLDSRLGGAAIDILKQPYSARRSVYAFIDRQNLPGLFRNFDFASPDSSTPVRHETTVPQQALFLMNSPFVVEAAQKLASRDEITLRRDPPGKVQALYRMVLARGPSEDEARLATAFLENASPSPNAKLSRVELLAQTLLLSNEFATTE